MTVDGSGRTRGVYLARVTWPAAEALREGRFLVHGAEAAAFFRAPTRGSLSWGCESLPFAAERSGDGAVLSGTAVAAAASELSDVGSLVLFRHTGPKDYEGRVLHRDEEVEAACESSGMGPVRTSWWVRPPR